MRKLNSEGRLAALAATGLMDEVAEAAFDRFTRLAAKWLKVPVAAVSLVDDHRQFFKSAVGLGEPWASRRETPLSHSFCQYAVTTEKPFVVTDAREHAWLKDNPAVSELGVVAYAGIPLVTSEQYVLGAFCVVDMVPRAWSEEDLEILGELAAMVGTEIELRARVRALDESQQAREEDRGLLRSILDCMTDAVVVSGADGRIILTNHAARVGRPADVLETLAGIAQYGMFMADGVTPLTPKNAPSSRAISGETVKDLEFVRRMPGVPDQTYSINAAPIRDASGVVRAAVSVSRDITASVAERGAVARSEALLRTVVSNLPKGAVLLFDRDLRYLMADGDQLLQSMGFTSRDFIGKTLWDVVSAERAEVVADRYRKTLSGEVQEFEVTRGERTYACTIVPVNDALGTVSAGMAMVYDVTALKDIERQLRRQTLVFQATLEHMREGVVMVSPDGDFGVFNRAAKSLLGAQPLAGEVGALLDTMRFFEQDGVTPLPEGTDPLRRALRGETSYPADVVVHTGHAAPVHLHVTVDPILDDGNALLGTVAVLHDVTAQRIAERIAREESASVELLQATASAANNARTTHEAFQACLDRVCAFMSWPVGHVYVVHGDVLKSSGWWHDDDPDRFQGFHEQTSQLEFERDAGMIGQVLGSGLATWLTDLSDPVGFLRSQAAVLAGLNSGFAFPVLIENEVVAVLEFYSERREEADLRLLSTMANIGTQLGRVVERERARKAAEVRAEAVRSQSIRDELTGLYNRRGFMELARLQLSLAQRESRSALLFFVDLNGMKQINDNLGHEEGDRALNETADVLREAFRATDVIARLGGDEFVALMLDATCAQIDVFGTRIRQAMALRNGRDDRRYRLSASVGAAPYEPAHDESIESLLVKADALMYEQKRARRSGQLLSLTPGRPLSGDPAQEESNPRG